VVTPVRNAAATLARAVASVRAQTEPSWEMLIVDDGSEDGSPALAARLAAGEPRIRLLGWREPRGAAAARNAAIRAARGRCIAFLDADDAWRPEKLARQLAFMAATGCPFVFAAYLRVAADGRPLGVVRPPPRVTRADLLKGNAVGCLTAIYDTAVLGRVEMPPLARRQDWGLWLELLRRTPEARSLPEVLAEYRVARGSLSSDKLAAARATWAVLRAHERLPLPAAAWCFAHYLAGALAKRAGDLRLPRLALRAPAPGPEQLDRDLARCRAARAAGAPLIDADTAERRILERLQE
jgi:glycosyltransferase involved in cell wall biosynthesis